MIVGGRLNANLQKYWKFGAVIEASDSELPTQKKSCTSMEIQGYPRPNATRDMRPWDDGG